MSRRLFKKVLQAVAVCNTALASLARIANLFMIATEAWCQRFLMRFVPTHNTAGVNNRGTKHNVHSIGARD